MTSKRGRPWPCSIRPIWNAPSPCARPIWASPRPRWRRCWPARAGRKSSRPGRPGRKRSTRWPIWKPARGPQEIVAAEATAAAAAADENRLLTDYRRKTPLFQRGTITAEEYDASKAAYQVALEKHRQAVEQLKLAKQGYRKQQIEEARWAAAQAKAQYDLVKAGPRQEDIDQGKAKARQAKAALDLAETQLGYATVAAPLTGVVLSKNIEPGEYVAPGTAVVTVGDLVNVWLRAYIEESDLGRVKVGQPAVITTDSFPGKKYEGVVSFIAADAEFTPKNVQTQKERVKLVYRIKIDIKNPNRELKPGMPADAVIEMGERGEGRGERGGR